MPIRELANGNRVKSTMVQEPIWPSALVEPSDSNMPAILKQSLVLLTAHGAID